MEKIDNVLRIKVLEAIQPLGSLYVGIVNANDLVAISETDERRLEKIKETPGKDLFVEYMGIQRPLDPRRKVEIQKYVKSVDASFPNSIIVAIRSEDVKYDETKGVMEIQKRPDVVTIIDGQHRLAGFMDNAVENFQLIVTIFLDLELESQAYMFSTINIKHVKMNASLAKDLLEFSSIETPEKLAHNIAKKFNGELNSPWYRGIKMLGRKDELSEGLITQHTFTKEIVDLIYDSVTRHSEVRDILKKYGNNRERLKELGNQFNNYPFWSLYQQNDDGKIYRILFNYFSAMREVFQTEWNNREYILNKTTGYHAFMKNLEKLVPQTLNKDDLTKEFFANNLKQIKKNLDSSGEKLTNQYFPAGHQGRMKLMSAFGV